MSRVCCLMLALFVSVLVAEDNDHTGILYGEDHAFMFTAPAEWILDTKVGQSMGLMAVMYLKDSTWQDSSVIAYPRAYSKMKPTDTIETVYKDILKGLQAEEPALLGKHVETIMAGDTTGEIYWFTGQANGTVEASVYFNEVKTVNYIVFSSRSQADFDKHYPAFKALALSYVFMGDEPMKKSEP